MFGDTHHIQPACVRGPDDLNDIFLVVLAERQRQVGPGPALSERRVSGESPRSRLQRATFALRRRKSGIKPIAFSSSDRNS